jgi:16S rRNA (cytidine1402-2'-O)-methyltransferase
LKAFCRSKKSRREHLEELVDEKRTMVFYEAPHKLLNTLTDFLKYFGDREIALVREITKIHEEVVKTTLQAAVERYTNEKPKGEFVLIVSGKKEQEGNITIEKAIEMAKSLVSDGMRVNAAAKEIASSTPFKKSDIYKALL